MPCQNLKLKKLRQRWSVKRNAFGINQRDIFEEIIWIESWFEVDYQEETAF